MKQVLKRESNKDYDWAPRITRFGLNEDECRKAFHHFMNLLNRAVFGSAFYRHGKRLNVIPILEKEYFGRWHYHALIEPPMHIGAEKFKQCVRSCWDKTHWGYHRIEIRDTSRHARNGWIKYMLKSRQKSGLEAWSDCIDWGSLHNKPTADV